MKGSRTEVLVMRVKVVDDLPHAVQREVIRVHGEDPAFVHIIWGALSVRTVHVNCNTRYEPISVHMVSRGILAAE